MITPEFPVHGLGRLLHHDQRSRGFALTVDPGTPQTVRHAHYGLVLDQRNTSACTGFAMAQWLNCHPAHRARTKAKNAADALSLYSQATRLDPFPGEFPPVDEGSSGQAACQAAQQFGLISGYRWIFDGTPALAAALQVSPVMAGTVWLDGMFTPVNGYLNVSGREVGGHEFVIVGYNRPSRYFTMLNSWGSGWGRGGFARIREADMQRLLDQQGDLTVPVQN